MTDEVRHVTAAQRITAREHEQGVALPAEGGDAIQQRAALVEGELERVAMRDGLGAAVHARQRAGLL